MFLQDYQNIMSNETEKPQVTKQAEDWFKEGQVYYDSKQYEEAAESLKKATQLNPDDAVYWYWQGRVLDDLKQYKEARVCYQKAIRLNPQYFLFKD